MDILKLCGVGLLCALAGVILRQIKGEYAALTRVAGAVLIFGALAISAYEIFSEVSTSILGGELSGYGGIMLKALGIAIVARICGDICRDMGESTVGSGVELGGKLCILALCLPLIGELMGYASELLELG